MEYLMNIGSVGWNDVYRHQTMDRPPHPRTCLMACIVAIVRLVMRCLSSLCECFCSGYERTGHGSVESTSFESDDNSCSICMEPLKTDVVTLRCNHIFHWHCMDQWFNQRDVIRKCPLCNAEYLNLAAAIMPSEGNS